MTTTSALTADQLRPALARHVRRTFGPDRVRDLHDRFATENIVVLRQFCPPELTEAIAAEARSIAERNGTPHDLVFAITDSTPRRMTTVGQPVIRDEGPLIHAFYFNPDMLDIASDIVGERVHVCPYAGEHYVISVLDRTGDTHGWHWDDYTYGIILVLEAPPYTDGGFVQAAPGTSWDKQNPDVYGALLRSQVRSYALEPGDAYLIKTNTTMHRVHPIRGDGRRMIVNMTLASTADLSRPLTHETNDVLFGGTTDPRRAK
ncbi:hypothetical protein Acy02nite_77140 [Actinoplanes cyaneus]|uniref:Fe2OG dioxygenase domain-containing protein n=1 Tax=Actinoplanes cyaneus TaxID=52696 RepID=A0A919M9U9_9ACTN|nr:hypothetical protein [Actinoplanes cyaneus]MCW2139679.1 hypothetical protein [Actinoplanes cyaneus]GID69833.1 hypothetical protein Acy02nite_77140 [Actinoplanes cyaneus]